uniref:Glycerate dehydrogenase n=1 Tax=Pyrodinium bahamense TaxID=73915 RepID=A0A7S0FQF2_9DINO|mmetsp:Transcript_40774/g.113352  ORF Transcript_40774/g.113352 Transcript_40774/m.113352 type:complete len:367 (+) Transcript_40774:55-1155(+)
MAQTSQQTAARRLRRIVAAAAPQPVPPPGLPAPCAAAPSIAELEGEAIGRFAAVKVVLLKVGERGVPLASQGEVEKLFKQRSLEPVWVDQVNDIPEDAAVIVTTGTLVGAEILAKMPKLRLVAVAFTGVDHIDLAACKARGVKVANVPGYSTDATAELAIGLVLAHLRRLPTCQQSIKDGMWACPRQEDLQSKTVGLVGVGRIGMRLAELFKAFKVKALLGYSSSQDAAFTLNGGAYVESLAGLFLDSDIVIVSLPLTATTKGLISEKIMELLRPECILVNVGRGGVVDEAALAKFLAQGRFRAALDVFDEEPLPTNDPLRAVPEEALLMTPHVGYQSTASLQKRLDATVKNILAFLAGEAINSVV